MTQQLFDGFYKDEFALAMDCAVALNEEIRDLFAAGADVVQLDEPFLEAQPEKARTFGVAAINRALEGVNGTTAVHLCFGYGARVSRKPSSYSFLRELEDTKVDQISIETAQPKLDCSALVDITTKQIILGVLDLGDFTVETPEIVAQRYPESSALHRGRPFDHRAGLRPQVLAARRGLCQIARHGRGRCPRPARAYGFAELMPQAASACGGAMNSGPTGSLMVCARIWSISAMAPASICQPVTSWMGAS